MNNKHYIGKRVSDFESYTQVGPITGIALILDDENELVAGDDTGYVMEVQCPYGTQDMADDLLSKLSGQVYRGYHADGAELPLDAELGDGVTIDGMYSLLAYRSVTFGPGHFSEVSAPGENELEHEFPYVSQEQRQIDRKIATTRSLISKTAEEILLQVEDVENELGQTLRIAADGVTITNADGDTLTIDGGQIDATKIKTEDLDASKINAEDLVLTGTITWKDLSYDAQGAITDAQETADEAKETADDAKETADSAKDTANSAQSAANGAYTAANGAQTNLALLANGQYQGGTFISGRALYSPELIGDSIKLTNGSSYSVGEITLKSTSSPAFDITSYLSLRLQSAAGWNAYLGNGYASGSGKVAAVLCDAAGALTLYGDSGICVSSASFGSSLPTTGTAGQVFFLLG